MLTEGSRPGFTGPYHIVASHVSESQASTACNSAFGGPHLALPQSLMVNSKQDDEDTPPGSPGGDSRGWQLIWCDERAFKQQSSVLKTQLEQEANVTVKAHKSAEKCIRSLQKKQKGGDKKHSTNPKKPRIVVLTSWANASTLVPYISELAAVAACIVSCVGETSQRVKDSAVEWCAHFPIVTAVTGTWEETLPFIQAVTLQGPP